MDGGHYLPEEWPGLGLTQSSLRPENKIDINVVVNEHFAKWKLDSMDFLKLRLVITYTL